MKYTSDEIYETPKADRQLLESSGIPQRWSILTLWTLTLLPSLIYFINVSSTGHLLRKIGIDPMWTVWWGFAACVTAKSAHYTKIKVAIKRNDSRFRLWFIGYLFNWIIFDLVVLAVGYVLIYLSLYKI